MRSVGACALCVVLIVGCGGDEPSSVHTRHVQDILAVINRCPDLHSSRVKGEREKVVRCLLVAADNHLDDVLAAGRLYRGEPWTLRLLNQIVFKVPLPTRGQRDGTWPLDVRSGRIVLTADPPVAAAGYSFPSEFEAFRRRYGARDLAPFRRQKLEGFVDPPATSRRWSAPRAEGLER